MKYQNTHESSRVKRARNVQVEAHTVPSKASNTKTRILGDREPQQSVRERNAAIPNPILMDTEDRHTRR